MSDKYTPEPTDQQSEIDSLRSALAKTIRQRDEALAKINRLRSICKNVLINIDGERPSSGEEPAARHTPKTHGPGNGDSTGLSAASSTCDPMTGEELHDLIQSFRRPGSISEWHREWHRMSDSWQQAMHKLAARIWPQPAAQPQDRREALRAQIVRTEHGPNLIVLQLGELDAIVQRDSVGWWWQVPLECSHGESIPQADAISAAEDWLIDEALKKRSEYAENE